MSCFKLHAGRTTAKLLILPISSMGVDPDQVKLEFGWPNRVVAYAILTHHLRQLALWFGHHSRQCREHTRIDYFDHATAGFHNTVLFQPGKAAADAFP